MKDLRVNRPGAVHDFGAHVQGVSKIVYRDLTTAVWSSAGYPFAILT